MNLNTKLKKLAKELGVSYFGVCDLAPAREFIVKQGTDILAKYERGISIGIRMPDEIVNLLPHRSEKAAASNYRLHAYDYINQRLNYITSLFSSLIQEEGYPVMPIPAAERYDNERICALVSQKLIAHLAGLGWIGKSCLLVTPDHGPRVRWSSLLTTAPLKPTGSPMEEKCGTCTACVEICPTQAFTNRNFKEDEERELRYDAASCQEYFDGMKAKGDLPVCGLCVYVCPYGRK